MEKLLGPRKFTHEVAEAGNQVGVTTGLVWTEFGGEIIFVEATQHEGPQAADPHRLPGERPPGVGPDRAELHPQPCRASSTWTRISSRTRISTSTCPSGAIPKDGPSAGVTIALALLSLLTGRPARRDVALTGELTLSGRILPVSGIREKVLAAQRAGVKTVVFPKENEVDIERLEEEVKEGVEIVLADEIAPLVDLVLLAK